MPSLCRETTATRHEVWLKPMRRLSLSLQSSAARRSTARNAGRLCPAVQYTTKTVMIRTLWSTFGGSGWIATATGRTSNRNGTTLSHCTLGVGPLSPATAEQPATIVSDTARGAVDDP